MDLCGPVRVQSINGKRYVLVVVDDYSRYTWRVRTDNGTEFKNKTLAEFFDEDGISQHFFAARTPQQNGVVERRNRILVKAARTMLTFANLPSFLWAETITTACFTQNHSIIHKRFDKTPYELINKRKPNIKFFRVFRCRCYLLNDYEDVGNLKDKGDIGVFVGYSKESAAFRIYNKQTRKIHESVDANFDEILEMASKQFSLEPGLTKLNETGKSSNQSVSKVSEASRKDLEDLFEDFYDEYFDSSKIMKSSTTNVETPIIEEVFHEVSESFQGESSLSSLNDNVQQSPEELILPQTNTQLISNNMVPNGDEASTSHNMFNELLEDAYFDAIPTPMVEQAKLKLDLVGQPVDHTDYRNMIGSLMYITSSRPDVVFATCMVKEFRINRMNPGLNTRFWTRNDVDQSKAFMFAIQKRLKTRRIFCNLESFVGGRVREGDYRLLKHTE
nr:hypothetical protein [Tanacetum cinerariifolium]